MRTRQRIPHLTAVFVLGAGILFNGCVDVQDTLPAASTSGVKVHPDGWTQTSSDAFHGKAVRADGWDLSSCQTCHGQGYNGGTAQKSCLTCHNQATGPEDCATCHGSAVNPAPPEDTEGNTTFNARGVGVHQSHLVSTSGKAVQCQECHTVPAAYRDIGHIDSTQFAEVMFNDTLARKTSDNGSIVPNPTYSATTLTCSSTYCHGTFENGNQTNAPHWTDPATGACGTCHGQTGTAIPSTALPKTAAGGGTHPPDAQCQWCHSNINAGGVFTNAATHIDGNINLKNLSGDCSACHGSETNAAPPTDLEGNTTVQSRGVGAHQTHLVGSGKALEVPCAECHTVPSTVYAGGHLDTDRPAEVVFGSLASLSSTPVYNASSVSCSNTYCHGSFTNGNATTTPVWNGAAGTGAVCGTCHGDVTKATTREKALPLGTHPTWTSCQWCHTNIDATATITDGSAHVNGTVNLVTFDLPADCARCHGSGTNPAPPNDLDGNTSVTGKGVGAHQAHLAATGAKEIACSECHSVPTAVYESGHLDSDRPAEVAFNGTLAGLTTLGVTPNPTYSSTSASCADTYCHGSFANGNETNAPVWNSAAGSAAECGTCHGDKTKSTTPEKALPKTTAAGGSHPNYTECQWCHTTVTAGPTFVNVDNHVDGEPALFQYTSTADCSRCHGSASNPAPPNDLSGNASSAKVGAHQAHLNPAIAAAVECFECHTVPTTLDYTGSDGHLDGTSGVEITFADSLAGKPTVGGPIPNPTYTSGTMSCGSTYCHGTFKNGNETNAPVWNNPAAAACGTCHGDPVTGNPRPGGNHSTNDNCGICHSVSGGSPVATFNSADSTWTITNKDLHLNGKLSLFTAERNPWP